MTNFCVRRALCVVLALSAAPFGRAQIVAPTVPINGLSQAELSARWWTWAVSYPSGMNPLEDTTGAFSFLGADQTPVAHPGVFFLAGNLGTPSTRTVTVQSTDFLFFPIVNTANIIPFGGSNEAELRAIVAAELGTASGLFLRLNGAALPLPPPTTTLNDFVQDSPPGLFNMTFPNNAIFGVPAGTYPAVSRGYNYALAPLAPGNYLLEFGGMASGTPPMFPPFSQQQTYLITVVPEPASLLLGGVGAVGLVVARCRRGRLQPGRAGPEQPGEPQCDK